MKSSIIGLAALASLLVPVAASADPYFHYNRGHYHRERPVIIHRSGPDWIFPMVGGVIVGAVIADAAKKEQPQPPVVVVPQQPVVVAPATNCTAWKEIQTSDGTIYRERYCTEGR